MADGELMTRKSVIAAIESRDSRLLREAISQMEYESRIQRVFSDESVGMIVDMLGAYATGNPPDLSFDYVLDLVEYAVELLTPPQRSLWIRSLRQVGTNPSNREWVFPIAQVLGFCFLDREALEVIVEFVRSEHPLVRRHALRGLEGLIISAADGPLRSTALELCRECESDGDHDVRLCAKQIVEAATRPGGWPTD